MGECEVNQECERWKRTFDISLMCHAGQQLLKTHLSCFVHVFPRKELLNMFLYVKSTGQHVLQARRMK